MKDDIPAKWAIPQIANWVKQFDEVIQDSAKEILTVLQSSSTTEQQRKEAAIKNGIPLSKVTRVPIKSPPPLVAVGAAMAC